MDATKKDVAIRKRQLITASQRKMFIWVAGASVLIGFALVTSWFLYQKIAYKEKVLAAKSQTVSTLRSINKTAPDLASNVRKLEANQALIDSKANDNENAVQVILDSLPSENNPFALGASLQRVLIGAAQNVTLTSFSIENNSTTPVAAAAADVIPFFATVSSPDINAIKDMLVRLESSIRTIDIDNFKIEQSATVVTITLQGHAYYSAPKTIELTDKVVPVK